MTENKCSFLMSALRKCLLLGLLVLFAFPGAAWAEYVQGNLSARFEDDVTLTCDGVVYRLRNRITSLLFLGMAEKDNTEYQTEMLILLAVDDNKKLITPIQIDVNLLQEQIVLPKTGEIPLLEENGVKENCASALQRMNDFLPAEILEHYLVFDFQGLSIVDGLQTENYEERVRAVKNQVESMTTDQLNDLFGELSDFIVTDMKSGELIKIMDKAEWYERTGMIRLTAEEGWNESNPNSLVYSEDALIRLLVDVFFEEKVW